MSDVLISTASGDMPAYVAAPPTSNPAHGSKTPGVVVIHDAFGMTSDHRHQADWLAAAGFLALAPDLFHHGGKISCIRAAIRDIAARQGRTFDDIEAGRRWLSQHGGCTGKVGVIGFCLGGGFALLLASGHGYSASSVNYGPKLPADIETLLKTACPIVASYGAKDRATKGVAVQLERELQRAGLPHDVKEYPNAGHGFMNHHHGLFFKIISLAGVRFEEQSALDARRRISAFFHEHLGQTGSN
jgi:carboxymethylenebutenolidase